MKIDFQPIGSIHDVEDVLSMLEVRTIFTEATYVADLQWDEDQLLRSLVESLEDPEAKKDFAEEPTAGIQEAKDRLMADLQAAISARHGELGVHSPFRWDFAAGVLLARKRHSEVTASSIAYLWLSLFWLASSDKDYLIIEKQDAAEFRRLFSAVFEQICCLVVSGRTSSAVWYLGDSRDVREFLRRLGEVVRFCGTGTVKEHHQLEENQVGANDAGVDVIAIESDDGTFRRDALAYLVGATIQRTDRRKKIMGVDETKRFTDYFGRRPNLAYKGVLAIPFDRGIAEEQTCRDKDCLYLTKVEILRYLATPPPMPGLNKYLRYPTSKLLRASWALGTRLRMANDHGHSAISWG